MSKPTRRNLITAAYQLDNWKSRWNKQFRAFFEAQKPLSADRFWELLPLFRSEIVHQYQFNVKNAAYEFFRKPACDAVSYTLDEALRFAVTYRQMSEALYTPLFDVITDRGDDSYGDLLDAMPLAGRVIYEKCLSKYYGNNVAIETAIGDEVPKLARFIMRGENYIRSTLIDAASERYSYVLRDLRRAG